MTQATTKVPQKAATATPPATAQKVKVTVTAPATAQANRVPAPPAPPTTVGKKR